MDQLVIDAEDRRRLAQFSSLALPPARRLRSGSELAAAVERALAEIDGAFTQFRAGGSAIRRDSERLGQTLGPLNEALEELERSRERFNQASAAALEEGERARRMRDWVERSARAMESGDIDEMLRVMDEHPEKAQCAGL